MTDISKTKLWTSRKTGWILYPGIVLFVVVVVTVGFYIRISPGGYSNGAETQHLWSILSSELLK